MNSYTDYQNYVMNVIATIDLTGFEPGKRLIDCVDADRYKDKYDMILEAGLGDLVVKDYVNHNSTTGFCAVALEDPVTGDVGVSYRGTENLDKLFTDSQVDMADNILTAVTGTSLQKIEAVNFFEKNRNKDGNNFLYGHSKGGELASEAYAEFHEQVDGMHIYNPQPINHLKLTDRQKAAFMESKVDVVIIDGDFVTRLGELRTYGDNVRYMQCNAKKNEFYYPHLLEAATFNENDTVAVELHPYEKYPDQYAVGLAATELVTASQVFIADLALIIVVNVHKSTLFPSSANFELFKTVLFNALRATSEKAAAIVSLVDKFINDVKAIMNHWYNRTFNSGYREAASNPYIEVNTATLRMYAARLKSVNDRLKKVDERLDELYLKVGLRDIFNLLRADLLTSYSLRLGGCARYLEQTAEDLERTERDIADIF